MTFSNSRTDHQVSRIAFPRRFRASWLALEGDSCATPRGGQSTRISTKSMNASNSNAKIGENTTYFSARSISPASPT